MPLPASLSEGDGAELEGQLLNVGLGGACVDVQRPVELGAEVTLRVSTPVLWEPLVVRGRVMWVGEGAADGRVRLGLRFDHERSRVIRSLLELLATDEFE